MTRVPHSTVFTYNSYFTHKMTDRTYKLHKYCNKYIHLQYRCIPMTSSFTSQTPSVFSNKNHCRISLYKKHNTNNFPHWVLLSPAMWSASWGQICIFNKWIMLVRLAIDQRIHLENISVFSPRSQQLRNRADHWSPTIGDKDISAWRQTFIPSMEILTLPSQYILSLMTFHLTVLYTCSL